MLLSVPAKPAKYLVSERSEVPTSQGALERMGIGTFQGIDSMASMVNMIDVDHHLSDLDLYV